MVNERGGQPALGAKKVNPESVIGNRGKTASGEVSGGRGGGSAKNGSGLRSRSP